MKHHNKTVRRYSKLPPDATGTSAKPFEKGGSCAEPKKGAQGGDSGAKRGGASTQGNAKSTAPIVTVIGAGITGLTAAHELAARGFAVQVIEPCGKSVEATTNRTESEQDEKEVRPPDEAGVAVGGVAKTQWNNWKTYPEGDDAPVANHEGREKVAVSTESVADVEVPGAGRLPTSTMFADLYPKVPHETHPGEHGYRFFPSFYHHIFDTLRRIPIEVDLPGGYSFVETVYDHLQPTTRMALALEDDLPPMVFDRKRPESLAEAKHLHDQLLRRLGFSEEDIIRYQMRMLKWLTASSERRAAWSKPARDDHGALIEGSGTWWHFVFQGKEDEWSPDFRQQLQASTRALLGMGYDDIDAQTYGNVSAQLLLDQLRQGARTDMTLDGPASTVWFRPWKAHLKSLGVRFFQARLDKLCIQKRTGLKLDDTRRDQQGRGEDRGWQVRPVFSASEDCEPKRDSCAHLLSAALKLAEGAKGWGPHPESHQDWDVPSNAPGDDCEPTDTQQSDDPNDPKLYGVFCGGNEPMGASTYYVLAIPLEQVWEVLGTDLDSSALGMHLVQRLVGLGESASDRQRKLLGHDLSEINSENGQSLLIGARMLAERKHRQDDYKTSIDGLLRLFAWKLLVDHEANQELQGSYGYAVYGPHDGAGAANGPFRTLSGIQYYFTTDWAFNNGHMYWPQSAWGLSAISQQQFWLDAQQRGIFSVDIGDFHTAAYLEDPDPDPFLLPNPPFAAWGAKPSDIAEMVWCQVIDGMQSNDDVPDGVPRRGRENGQDWFPQPAFYHLDDYLLLDDDGRVYENRAPFLINRPVDWDRRPGFVVFPHDHKGKAGDPEKKRMRDHCPGRGQVATTVVRYPMDLGQWVIAGPHMKTLTRMTTMEAANESARHAVNRILTHLFSEQRIWLERLDSNGRPDGRRYHYKLHAEQPGVWGAHQRRGPICKTFNMENDELFDLRFAKEIDHLLFREGKPHPFDILGVDSAVDELLGVNGEDEPGALRQAFAQVMSQEMRETEAFLRRAGGSGLGEVVRHLSDLQKLVDRGTRGKDRD